MKLLVIGGSSYLGRYLVPLARLGGHEVAYTWFSTDPLGGKIQGGTRLDVRQAADVDRLVTAYKPSAIVHLAGSNRSPDMDTVIQTGTRAVTEAASKTRSRLVFVSTDVIFDGRSAPYSERDAPAPPHPYGAAKAEAEQIVGEWADHVIVRPSLIYGLSQMDLGTRWMVDALEAGRPVTLFTDQLRAPVWVDALAAACLELAAHEYTGILHVAGPQPLSRAEFGERLLDWWGVADRAGLRRGPTPAGAPWPRNTILDINLAKRLLRTSLPGVDDLLNRAKSNKKKAK